MRAAAAIVSVALDIMAEADDDAAWAAMTALVLMSADPTHGAGASATLLEQHGLIENGAVHDVVRALVLAGAVTDAMERAVAKRKQKK